MSYNQALDLRSGLGWCRSPSVSGLPRACVLGPDRVVFLLYHLLLLLVLALLLGANVFIQVSNADETILLWVMFVEYITVSSPVYHD